MKIKITIKKESAAAKAVEAYKANKKAIIKAIKSGNGSNDGKLSTPAPTYLVTS